jgi:hypothetical protein
MKNIYVSFVKVSIVVLFLGLSQTVFAQLSGIKAIPADYPSINAFVTDLNLQGVGAGGVTLNVPAGYTENLTGKITVTATGTAANPIVIQKIGVGANPVIVSYVGTIATPEVTADGMFVLAGSDYVTIDGIDLAENVANTTTTTVMEFGFGLYLASASDGCQNNTIKNCVITLNRIQNSNWNNLGHTGSIGINILNSLYNLSASAAVVATSASGSNSYNKFYSNTIQNCNVGITFIGFPDVAPYSFANTGNDVGGSSSATGNTILNFGGAVAATNPSTGIFVKDEWGINVSYNTLNNNNGSGVNHSSTLRGIFSNLSSTGASQTINNNTITLKSAVTTSQVSAIECSAGANGVGNTIDINNNTITNCTNDLATTSIWYGIYNTGSASNLNINNNIFTTNSTRRTTGTDYLIYNTGAVTGTINITNNSLSQNYNLAAAQAGISYYIRNSGGSLAATANLNNNTFSGINFTTLSTTTLYYIYNSVGVANLNINSNNWNNITTNASGVIYLIYNLSSTQVALNANGNQITTGYSRGAAAAGSFYCYYAGSSSLGSSTQTISNNNFSNITATTAGTGIFYGIYNSDGSASPYPRKNIFNNTISNISYPSTGTWYGIFGGYLGDGGTSTGSQIYNNTVSNITTTSAQYALYTSSLASPNQPVKIYGNTIQNLTSNGLTSSVMGYYAFASTTSPYYEFYNNKIANLNSNGTTGKVYGIYALSAANYRIHNNYIGDLTASGALTTTMPTPALIGVFLSSSSNVKLYNNTIYLNATSTGANFSTTGIYSTQSGVGVTDAKNNIIHNTSVATGAGLTIGVQLNSLTGTIYSPNSNNNNWYLGTVGTSNVTYYNGTMTGSTVANMTAITGSDQSSISTAPTYTSTLYTNPGYLHIDPSVPSQIEGGGQPLTNDFSVDFDNDIRATNVGYSGTGTSYDIGADEFSGSTPAPSVSILSSVPTLINQCVASSRAITANISTGVGSITSATLNYSFNGVGQVPIAMVNTAGNSWTATIPVATPNNATVTWNINAVNSAAITTILPGTSYADEPLTGVNAFAFNGASPVCAGTNSSLTVNLFSTNAPVNYPTPIVTVPLNDEDLGTVQIFQGATMIIDNTTPYNSLTGTIGTATGTAGSYSNFTAFGPYAMTAGQTYSFSLSSILTGTFGNHMRIYLDLNRNGVFTDLGECMYVAAATTPGAHTETGVFTIPASAYAGLTRMRIFCHEGAPSAVYINTFGYGEFEDYMINITSAFNGGGGAPAITSVTWNGAATGLIGTGNPLALSPTQTDSYTATVLSAGCPINSNPTTVTVNPLPSAPTATNSTQCGLAVPGASVASTSGANGSGSYYWYNSSTNGNILQAPPLGPYTMFYQNNFSATTIGVGATLTGSANLINHPGELQLFNQANNAIGGILVSAGVNANAYMVDFDVITSTGADGFSYSFGDDVNPSATIPSQEKGSGSKIKISFDAYGAMPNGQGIYLLYNNTATSFDATSLGVLAYSSDISWVNDTNHVSILIDNTGKLTLTVGTTVIFNAVALPGAYLPANKATWQHAIAGRTGLINMLAKIDNLYIQYANQLVGSPTFQTAISSTNTYYVSEMGTNGCLSATTAITANVVNPDPIAVTPGATNSFCVGNSFSVNASSIANPAYTYSWDANNYVGSGFNGPLSGAPQSITPIAAGTYVYTVTGTNGVCTATETVTTTVNPLPTITSVTATPNAVCNNSNVTLTASSFVTGPQTLPNGYCTVSNSGGTGTFINNVLFNTLNNNSSASNPTAAPYYTLYNLSTSVNIGQTYPLTITMGPPGTYTSAIVSVWVDFNRDGVLSAAEWQQVGVNVLANSTVSINITVPNSAVAGLTKMRIRTRGFNNVNGANDACLNMGSGETEDYSISIQGAPTLPYNYVWNTVPPITTASGSFTNTNSTGSPVTANYTVTVTEPISGCVNTGTTNTVTFLPIIFAPTVVNSVHCGLQIPTATANDVNNFSGELYNWYASPTATTPLQSNTTNTYNSLVGATTTFYVTVTDSASGCQTPASPITVTSNPAPAFGITPSFNACQNGSYPLTATTGGSSYNTFTWSPATSLFNDAALTSPYIAGTSASIVYFSAATLGVQPTITCSAIDNGVGVLQCGAAATVNISVQAIPIAPIIAAPAPFICSGTTSAITVQAGGTYCASGANNTYDEEIFNVTLGTLNNSSTCLTLAGGPGSILEKYSNYTSGPGAPAAPNIAAGATTTGSVTIGSCGTFNYTSGLAIFVDLNQDGDFIDAGEKVYSSGATANLNCVPATAATVSLIIPSSALNGLTRMRIVNQENTSGNAIGPCTIQSWGETEDYLINITGGASYNYTWTPAVAGNSTAASVTTLPLTVPTTYTVVLNDGTCSSAPSNAINIGIAGTPVITTAASSPVSGYCPSAAGFTFDEEIFNVTLGTMNNTSDCFTPAGGPGSVLETYSNFTSGAGAPAVPNLAAGSTTAGSVTVGSCGNFNYTSGLAVFIDFNQDGDFTDAGEKVFTNGAVANVNCVPATAVPISVTVPATAVGGQTRMRVVNQENISGDNITPCTIQSWGETEDYLVNITGGAVNIPCPGSTFNLSSTATNGGAPYTYAWTVLSGSATLSATNIANPTAVVNTDAVLQLTVTDVCGSVVTSTVAADIDENPITITPANSAICINSSTTLTAANGSNYTWTPTNDLSASNTAVVVANPTSTVTYTVNGTYGIGCSGSTNTTVTVNPLPIVNAGLDQTICLNTPVVLNGAGATSYAWNNNVSNGVAFTPTASNTYTVVGTDANGCVNQDQVSITVNALPVINAGLNQTVCAGSVVVLNGSGGFNGYTWNNGVNNGQNFIPTATANYIVSGIGSNGCANQDTVLVTVNNTPVITIASGGTSICQNGLLSLTASTQNAFSGFWQTNNGSGVFSPNITNSSVNYQASTNDPSTVDFSYVAFNQCGATTQNTSVSILAIPTLAAGPDLMVCENEAVTLNASSTGTVSWSNGVLNNTPFNATLGSASYTATAVGSNGCIVTDQVTITGMPLPNIQAGNNQSICLGNAVTLSASGGISYSWNNGVINNVPFAPTATAVYAVTGFGTNGCSQLDNVSVTVNPVPTASINLSGSVVLTASPAGMSYQWINCGTGQEIADATGASYTATYNGSYAVIVTNANGCSDTSNCEIVNAVGLSDVAAATVGVYPNPTTGQVTIEYPGQDLTSIQIYDAQGKLLMNYPQFKSGEAIQLERFATGVYTIIIENNVIQHIERIVKQ